MTHFGVQIYTRPFSERLAIFPRLWQQQFGMLRRAGVEETEAAAAALEQTAIILRPEVWVQARQTSGDADGAG